MTSQINPTGRFWPFIWVTAILVAALGSGLLVVADPYLGMAVATSIGVCSLWAVRMSSSYWMLSGILAIFASSSSFAEDTTLSVFARFSGLALIAIGGLVAKTENFDLKGLPGNSPIPFGRVLLPLFGLLLFSTVPHGQILEFIGYSVGLILIWTALWASTHMHASQLRFAVERALIIMVLGSLVSGFLIPSFAVEGERLRGLTNNANLLGFYCFALSSLVLLGRRMTFSSVIWLGISLSAIFWAASRASMLAIAVMFIASAIMAKGISRKIALVGLAVGAPISVIWFPELSAFEVSLFRSNNSRDTSIANGLALFADSPLLGIGMDDTLIIASSPLRALAYAGIWGAFFMVLIYIGMLRLTFRAHSTAGLFSIAAIIHSLFEGWLLSPISPIFAVFMLVALVLMRNASESPTGAPYLKAVTPGSGRRFHEYRCW